MFSTPYFVLCLALFGAINAIPIDNGIEGDPEVQCGASDITVNFNTRNPFEGHVYVKGLYNDEGCRTDGDSSITLDFLGCNVRRERSLEPRGVFVSTTIIIQFHPLFVTKIDRAVTFSCFFMEADKTVSQDLEVSMLTTGLQTQNVPMPVCRYDILDGPGGVPVKFAVVGQPVYHQWVCDTDTLDTFCMIVHSCYVDDGAGDQVDLLNGEGCAIDKFLLRNLEYPEDLLAGQETHVFKYADRTQLFFQCQIALTIKEPEQECPLPQCPALGGRRLRRSAPALMDAGTIDVHAVIDALNLDDGTSPGQLPAQFQSHRPQYAFDGARVVRVSDKSGAFCLSPVGLGLFGFVLVLTFLTAVITSVMLYLRSQK